MMELLEHDVASSSGQPRVVRSGTNVGGDKNWHSSTSSHRCGVEVRALCRPVTFFYTKLGKPCLHGLCHFEAKNGSKSEADDSLKYHCML